VCIVQLEDGRNGFGNHDDVNDDLNLKVKPRAAACQGIAQQSITTGRANHTYVNLVSAEIPSGSVPESALEEMSSIL
jgi:hypothetical protein